MSGPRTALLAALLFLVAAPAAAQETQVPLDDAGLVQEIDRELARRTGLFLDDYPDLRMVRLFETGADTFVLEVTYDDEGRTARRRVPLTAAEVADLRARVGAALAEHAPEASLDQDGRFLLLGTTTAMGLGFYGWAVPTLLDLDTARGALAAYMLTAGASFVLPYLYTRDRPVTYGMANAGFWGSTRGLYHGLFLAGLMDESPSARTAVGLGLLGSLGEGLGAYSWARNTDMSAGDAHVIGNHGDFGQAWAGTAMMMVRPSNEQALFGALLAGAGLGLAMGPSRAESLPYTWGDAEVQRLGFLLGAANAGVVFDWVYDDPSDDDYRLLGALLAAGSAGGLYLADRMLPGHDFTAGQGILIDLGTIAGGLLGMGVAYLASSDDPTGVLTLGAIGADLGFLATWRSLAADARRRADRGTPAGEERSLRLELNPGALLLVGRDVAGAEALAPAVPLLSVRYRF